MCDGTVMHAFRNLFPTLETSNLPLHFLLFFSSIWQSHRAHLLAHCTFDPSYCLLCRFDAFSGSFSSELCRASPIISSRPCFSSSPLQSHHICVSRSHLACSMLFLFLNCDFPLSHLNCPSEASGRLAVERGNRSMGCDRVCGW